METKICKYCGTTKQITEFLRNQWGYTDCCIECATQRRYANMGNVPRKRVSKQMRRIAELETKIAELETKLAEKDTRRLDDFMPRKLLEHLKKLGYKWEKMSFTRVEYVDWNKI